jgi:hypothetical protein
MAVISSAGIPPITDPLGRYWKQPPADSVLVDDEVALMEKEHFDMLYDYSASIPTGTYAGKMWKSQRFDGWVLLWYEDDPDGQLDLLLQRRPIVLI